MIDSYIFGEFVVNGEAFKSNVVLMGNTARKARYLPEHELKIDDFFDLVGSKPSYIIIGTGAYGVVKVPEEIVEYIHKIGIKLIIQKTSEACRTYNTLIKEGKKVAAFMHNTC